MSRKAFLVQVELEIQAVTCPGVWLCSNGKVSLQIYMLDSCVQTASYKPNFPIQCNEKFTFYKTFLSKHRLNELQNELHDQWMYCELVQWQSCEIGNVLASFQTTLDELLYPSTINGSIAGVDLDLLMEPSKTFPGTISPKIEVSTKTTIEETVCVCTKPTSSTVIVNPKVLTSTEHKSKGNVRRKVCHSIIYSKRKHSSKTAKTRPPFCYRKAEDDLILRKPQYDLQGDYCSCRRSRSLERQKTPNLHKQRVDLIYHNRMKLCPCGSGHKENSCPVCSKYKGYFNVKPAVIHSSQIEQKVDKKPRTRLFDENQKYSRRLTTRCEYCKPQAFSEDTTSETTVADVCSCKKKPSLAERLHEKLTKTLSSIPRSIEWSCYDYDYECECCDCPEDSSRGELYKDLQKFYGELYEKSKSDVACVPTCQR